MEEEKELKKKIHSRDYIYNQTVLKILCSVDAGNDTKKMMNSEVTNFNGEKRDYLPNGTLTKFLSGGMRFSDDEDKETFYQVKDMIKENYLIVLNEANKDKRLARSKEEYIYEVNYDLIADKFIEHINAQIIAIKSEFENKLTNLPDNYTKVKLMMDVIESAENQGKPKIFLDQSVIYAVELEARLQDYKSKLNLIKLKDSEKADIIDFLRTFLVQYYESKRSDLSLNDVFISAEKHLKKGESSLIVKIGEKYNKWWRIDKGIKNPILLEIHNLLNLIDLDFFDLAPRITKF